MIVNVSVDNLNRKIIKEFLKLSYKKIKHFLLKTDQIYIHKFLEDLLLSFSKIT